MGELHATCWAGVRITHVPTGIAVKCTQERSQVQNKAIAMEILRYGAAASSGLGSASQASACGGARACRSKLLVALEEQKAAKVGHLAHALSRPWAQRPSSALCWSHRHLCVTARCSLRSSVGTSSKPAGANRCRLGACRCVGCT